MKRFLFLCVCLLLTCLQGCTSNTSEIDEVEVSGVTDTMIEPPLVSSGNIIEYSPEILMVLLEEQKRVVLNFTAPWCNNCERLDQELALMARQIPPEVVFVKVDFDTYTDLRKLYGVTTTSTFVFLDEVGEMERMLISPQVLSIMALLG